MLARKFRLTKNSEFIATYAQKQYVVNSYLKLNLGKRKPFESFNTKVAFVVSKKIDKRAVVRNKIKRRMREAYKMLVKENPNYNKWMSMIFTSNASCKDVNFTVIKAQMKILLEKSLVKYA